MTARPSPVLVSLACLASLACFDPPELDDAPPPPLADLGSVDTWAPFEEAGPPSGEDPSADSGPDDPDSGGEGSAIDPALTQLRISEVLVDPAGKDGGADSPEFVEISNPGPFPAKLAGLRVTAASWPVVDVADLGVAELELGVGDLLVIRRWVTVVDPSLAAVEQIEGVIWSGFLHPGGLRNTDGAVAIDAGTMSIDQVIYGAEPTEDGSGWSGAAVATPGSDVSMCRATGADHDDADDWTHCPPNPGLLAASERELPEPTPIPLGALSIVEVSANPPGSSTDEKYYEYVEILNTSENSLELSGCRIGDAVEPDAPGVDPLEYVSGDGGCESPTCLAPGFRALLVGNAYVGESNGALVLSTDDSTIADGGLTNTEPVVLWDASNALITSYRLWPDPASDPVPTDEQPIHRVDPSAADEPASWISALPTPGI